MFAHFSNQMILVQIAYVPYNKVDSINTLPYQFNT